MNCAVVALESAPPEGTCRAERNSRRDLIKQTVYAAGAAVLTMSLMMWLPIGAAHAQVAKAQSYEAPVVFQAADPDSASIQATSTRIARRLARSTTATRPGRFRADVAEINWDGGGSTATSIAATPFAGFLNTRGALFVTPGSGFVQAPSSGLADTFSNPDYATIFQPFSPVRLFSPIGSTRTDVEFFVPGSGGGLVATTRGFGAIFSDVDLPDGSGPGGKRGNRKASTLVEYSASTAGCSTAASCPRHRATAVSRSSASHSTTARRPRADQHRQRGSRGGR